MTGPIADIFEPSLSRAQVAAESGRTPVFVAEGRAGPDLLDTAETLRPVAELCVHKDAQTPAMIGIVGPPGSGKSFALERLASMVDRLASAAAETPGSPFASRVVVVAIDAAGAAGDAASAVAAAVFAAFGSEASGGYAALADEAAHAGADPYLSANAALERHEDARRRLSAERQARDEAEARRVRLVDTVLFESAGSQVDAYARSRRAMIEARLRRFELTAGDSTKSFKHLVRDLNGAGWSARIGVAAMAIWGYRSQRRLLLAALVLLALAFGVSQAQTPRALDWLRSLGAPAASVADWLAAHADSVGMAVIGVAVLGVLALLLDFWRALLFAGMLARGARLLGHDLQERGRELDSAAARLNRRVAALSAEAEATAKHAEAAERRANARGSALAKAPTPSFVDAAHAGPRAARAFLAALGRLMSEAAGRTRSAPAADRSILGPASSPSNVQKSADLSPGVPAPERLLLLFDNLDALPPAEALGLIETAHSMLAPGFVAAVACDPAALAQGESDRVRSRLDKLIHLTVDIGRVGAGDSGRLIERLAAGADASRPSAAERVDASRSALSEPLSAAESTLLTSLAPLAARTPRGVKRYLNAYRVARTANVARPALALMLAVGQSGDEEAIAAMKALLAGSDPVLADPAGPPVLAEAVRIARAASEKPLTLADMLAATEVARRYQPIA